MTGANFFEMNAGDGLAYHNIFHNHCFQFLLGITVVPIEIEDNGHVEFFGGVGWGGGVTKVHYGLCENGE